jgi:hypothetical protein
MKIAIVVLEWADIPKEWTKEDVAREIALAFPKIQFAGVKVFELKEEKVK